MLRLLPASLWVLKDIDVWERRLNLTHCGLVTPYDDKVMGQHCFSYWLVAWWHQAITWTSVDLSKMFCGIHVSAISQDLLKKLFHEMSLKIVPLKSKPYLPGVKESNDDIHKTS